MAIWGRFRTVHKENLQSGFNVCFVLCDEELSDWIERTKKGVPGGGIKNQVERT